MDAAVLKVMPLESLYETMCLIRTVEESLLDLFGQGRLRGTVHTCLGQEGCAVGVVAAIDPARDLLFSNHRGHGHYLAATGDVRGLIAEVMGRPDGVCGGVGGSQHLHRGNYYSNGIQGAGAPITVGMALAEQRRGSGAIACVFLGDGTFGEGTVYEAFNLASLLVAPVMFVVESNGWAQSTPTNAQHAGDLRARAVPFGIPVVSADGMDVLAVLGAAEGLASRIRAGEGPGLLFLDTCRFGPHSKGDDLRAPALLARERERCPIAAAGRSLGSATAGAVLDRVRREVAAVVEELSR
ncbi:MAG: thiamine pyrophosphate-dependent dehydrogenase E1 component subunit alpha [Proteobacteria bacterium]|nr:thiamine pyrophosphate-dependent dehydrogenase E1 component subunit alpha [Pseudomonadota bacterium]